MAQIAEMAETSSQSPVDTMTKMLEKGTDIDREFILQRSPSELEPLVAAMLEVNNSFFEQTRAVGMHDAAKELEKMIRQIFIVAFLPLSVPDTEQ